MEISTPFLTWSKGPLQGKKFSFSVLNIIVTSSSAETVTRVRLALKLAFDTAMHTYCSCILCVTANIARPESMLLAFGPQQHAIRATPRFGKASDMPMRASFGSYGILQCADQLHYIPNQRCRKWAGVCSILYYVSTNPYRTGRMVIGEGCCRIPVGPVSKKSAMHKSGAPCQRCEKGSEAH